MIQLLRQLSTHASPGIRELTRRFKQETLPALPTKDVTTLASKDFSAKTRIDETKPPLVMIHGLFGSKSNYSSTARKISSISRIQTIGLDMRNHGTSPHVMPHDYNSMATDTIEYIAGLGKKVFLAGHSMGAKVAMIVALKRPDLVERLIVIDNAPCHEHLDRQFFRDLLGMYAVETILKKTYRDKFQLQKAVDSVLGEFEPDPSVRLFLASNLKHTKNAACQMRIPVLNFLKEDVISKMGQWPETTSKYSGPVLVMRGVRSPFVSDKHLATDFPACFPHVQVADFDCGHWIVSEMPDKFVEQTVAFLTHH